jgi:hemolysin III
MQARALREVPTIGEEIANSISHGVGAALSIAGLVLLILRASSTGGTRAVLCCTVFATTAVVLYLSSTLYHSLARTRARNVLLALDHGSIFLLIAGTYTPFTLLALRGTLGWTLFAIVWSIALAGVILKAFAAGRWSILSTAMYLAMGWACIFSVRTMLLRLTPSVLAFLFAGGLCYTAGIPFFASRRRYMHFLWHLWVIAGTACHYCAIWLMLR